MGDVKVGIITEYCGSINYGGNLQAYALCATIKSLGYNCEQIQYIRKRPQNRRKKLTVRTVIHKIPQFFLSKVNYFSTRFIDKYVIKNRLISQKKCFAEFNLKIPHSDRIYDDSTISACANHYDIFVTGSDQVWNLQYQKPAYMLGFVPENRIKISYAASIGTDNLSEKEQEYFRSNLIGYDGISVREEEAMGLLQPLTSIPVQWHLDPTLLLTKEDWDGVCADRIVEEKYIFCYFLGDDPELRKLAKEYARKHHLKIVTIPYLLGTYRKCDALWGDERRNDITPEKFLSLVKYAEYVLTDSFHACVFSLIFEKQFFVFSRTGAKKMGGRIYSLVKLFECPERFCDEEAKRNIGYMDCIEPISYASPFSQYEKMKNESINYIYLYLQKENIQG